jgi:hypothetical protein
MLSKVKEIKDAVQEIVDKGVTSVEEIHKSIVRIPFEHIEALAGEKAKPYVEPVKNIHDTMVGTVYEIIRKVNRQVGEIADEVLRNLGEDSGKAKEVQEAKLSA